jgi:hypothetical protein
MFSSMFARHQILQFLDLNYETCICIHPFLIVLDSKLILQSYLLLTFVFDYSYKE